MWAGPGPIPHEAHSGGVGTTEEEGASDQVGPVRKIFPEPRATVYCCAGCALYNSHMYHKCGEWRPLELCRQIAALLEGMSELSFEG